MAPPIRRRCRRKRVGGIGRTPIQEVVEARLLPQTVTSQNPAGLFALGLPDLMRRRQRRFNAIRRHEQDTIVVTEDDVIAADQVRSEPYGGEGVRLSLVEPQRA